MLSARAQPEKTNELLMRLWQRSMPVVEKRLDLLDAAAAAAAMHALAADLRTDAISEAHKLAGSLGMFGYARGTELAREIEELLEAPEPPPSDRLSALAADLRANLFPPPQQH